MVIFHSYVKLPEGTHLIRQFCMGYTGPSFPDSRDALGYYTCTRSTSHNVQP